MIKYDFLLKICLLLILSTIIHANELQKVSLQLHWKHQFEFAGLYAAKEQGYYKDEGLDVEIREVEPGKNSIKEVVDSRANYGITYSSLVGKYVEGEPVVMLANIFKHSALVLIAQENLHNISSLIGKRVMADKTSLMSSGINSMLSKFNISLEDIELVEPTYSLDDFIEKKVDVTTAYITNEPYHLNKKNIDYTIFNPANYGSGFYDGNLFTSLDEVKRFPKRTEAFTRASIKGWEYALTHSDEMIELILKKYNTQNKTKEALEYEATITKSLVLPYVYELGSIDRNIIDKIAKQFASQNNIAYEKIDFTNFYIDKEIINVDESKKYFYLKLFAVLFIIFLFVIYRYNKVRISSSKMKKNIKIIDDNVLISYSDIDGKITGVSEALCRMTGYTKDELIGKNHRIFRHPDSSMELFEQLWSTLLKGETFRGEIKNLSKDGTAHWIDAIITPLFDNRGNIEGFSAIRRNITDEKHAQQLAITDQLTQTYNRLHLENIFKSEIKRSERYNGTYSVLLMDVDNFKSINDNFGHDIGDIVLVEIVKLLKKNIRDVDILGRWGGEEFLIISTQTTIDEAEVIGEKLRAIIEYYSFDTIGNITCSFGISEYKDTDKSSKDVIKRADDALYGSKNNGRNRVTVNS